MSIKRKINLMIGAGILFLVMSLITIMGADHVRQDTVNTHIAIQSMKK